MSTPVMTGWEPWVASVGLALVTLVTRAFFMIPEREVPMPEWFKRGLKYAPLAALAAVMNDSLKESPEVTRVLLTDRNRTWAEWIAERMKRPGTVFMAVGAGHLAGAEAVQAQLRARGLKAERVRY